MFVGETGIARILERTCQLTKQAGYSGDVRKLGGIDLETLQKFINLWFSLSLDLHGNEVSTNAASYFAQRPEGARLRGQVGRPRRRSRRSTSSTCCRTAELNRQHIPMRTAMNEVLRDWYVGDCLAGVTRWNKILERHGFADRLRLPDRKFNRGIGMYSSVHFDPQRAPAARTRNGRAASTNGCRRRRTASTCSASRRRRSTSPASSPTTSRRRSAA